ncbi:MAG: hypothetical protein QM619_10855 [Micropruina sp.]|uniref:hypothetical protein n=1 Tax=Micropruina sp. TaxID=2737536 RepID=UPI0039E6EE33
MRRTLCSLALFVLLTGCTPILFGSGGTSSGSTAGFPCPPIGSPVASASPEPIVRAGRVHVGRVSYPIAPAPYGAPSEGAYLAFGNLVGSQTAFVERATASNLVWNSVIELGRLSSADGAWGAQRAAEVVSQCSLSVTWLGIDYHPQVRRDEQFAVDGHDGWIRITDLSFTVPGIHTTSEVQTTVIVQVGDESYAYLSYLPSSAPELQPLVDATRDGLRVD